MTKESIFCVDSIWSIKPATLDSNCHQTDHRWATIDGQNDLFYDESIKNMADQKQRKKSSNQWPLVINNAFVHHQYGSIMMDLLDDRWWWSLMMIGDDHQWWWIFLVATQMFYQYVTLLRSNSPKKVWLNFCVAILMDNSNSVQSDNN